MIDETDQFEKHLEYRPAPERLAKFDRELKRIVDEAPSGDLYLRFVWGMDETEVLDGRTMRRYPDPDGKYVGLERWVLEGWQNPEVYDEEQWRANEDVLGPYPANGVWDFIAIVEDHKKRFLPLGSKALDLARTWRHWRTKTKKRALEDVLADRCKLQVLKEKRWEARKQEILDEFVRDYSRAERGGYDPRKRTKVGKISQGEYQQTPSGMLIPKFT